jgi:cytochrome P450
MGRAFTERFPNMLEDLFTFDSKLDAMLLGIPRWLPFPGLPAAYAARRRLLRALAEFHSSFAATMAGKDPGFDWSDMDDVSDFMQTRERAWISAGFSADTAAAENLAILWAVNTRTSLVIFWNLLHILADPDLHAQIMTEITLHNHAWRPDPKETGFQMPEPPRLSLDLSRILNSCPLFKATYHETLRLQSSSFTYRKLVTDLVIPESDDGTTCTNQMSDSYLFCAGDFIAVPHALQNLDPRYFPDPHRFDPTRFLPEDIEGTPASLSGAASDTPKGYTQNQHMVGEMETIWPFGGDNVICIGRKFVEGQVLAFTAALLAMWDIEPAEGRAWKIPKTKSGSTVREPLSDIRVKMKLKV